jgi:glycosyltransferase involved in cell wall biosynthesis
MVGPDKGLLEQTKQLVQELGVEDKVIFEGRMPNDQLYKFYQTHAAYLNTTAYESFGVAVLEAAACGIPIVSTRVGEIPYMWGEGKEILMTEADSEAMVKEVKKIFDSSVLSEKLSANARKKAEGFDWKVIKNRWIKLLEEGKNDL